MDKELIEMAKEIGEALQESESYVQMRLCEQEAENDDTLRQLNKDINLIKAKIAREALNVPKDEEKSEKLQLEMKELYLQLQQNPMQIKLNHRKEQFDILVKTIMNIINLSSKGVDPANAAISSMGCNCEGGDCSDCG